MKALSCGPTLTCNLKANHARHSGVSRLFLYLAAAIMMRCPVGGIHTGGGTILFTGASSGVKGYANSAPYAMGKFALRGLCQSLARELHPQNIHIGHVVIDGRIGKAGQEEDSTSSDPTYSPMDPDEIARNYIHLIKQHRSSWSWEIELRPWVRQF